MITSTTRHNCKRWTFHAGMATCAHGYELLPGGSTQRANPRRWRAHRRAIDTALLAGAAVVTRLGPKSGQMQLAHAATTRGKAVHRRAGERAQRKRGHS